MDREGGIKFEDYHQGAFEREFLKYFSIDSSHSILDSQRTLYHMRVRD